MARLACGCRWIWAVIQCGVNSIRLNKNQLGYPEMYVRANCENNLDEFDKFWSDEQTDDTI